MLMRLIRISKGPGRAPRIVAAPSARRKSECRAELPRLMAAAITLDVHGVQHGFTPGRSPITCAQVHRGYQHTACWDLAGCFDHVGRSHVALDVSDACWHEGIARQGLPTSPALANIALAGLDADIVRLLAGRGVYTRYADDLTVSSDDRAVIDELLAAMPDLVRQHHHELAAHKTRVQSARAGRRIITGVSVAEDLHPTRESRRTLRAAQHRLACLIRWALDYPALAGILCLMAVRQIQIVAGLSEWQQLRAPNWARAALAHIDHPLIASAIAARQGS